MTHNQALRFIIVAALLVVVLIGPMALNAANISVDFGQQADFTGQGLPAPSAIIACEGCSGNGSSGG